MAAGIALSVALWPLQPIQAAVPVPSPATSGLSVAAIKKFAPKRVFVLVPTKWVYNASNGRTFVMDAKARRIVTARSDGSKIEVRRAGKWLVVPYLYQPAANTMFYDEATRVRLGVQRDPLGAPSSVPIAIGAGGGVKDRPSVISTEPLPAPGACDPSAEPCGLVGRPLGPHATGSYERSPAAEGVFGNDWRNQLLADINARRGALGLGALIYCPTLGNASQGWANYLAANDLFTHQTVDSQPSERVIAAGYTGVSSQEVINLGAYTPAQAVEAWRNSPGHWRALTRTDINALGAGAAMMSSEDVVVVATVGTAGC